MSRIGSSGQGTGQAAETGARLPATASRGSRFEDRPSDAGSRDAGLRRHAGGGSQETLSQADDPRAALFGHKLDGALSREERDGRRSGGRRDAQHDLSREEAETGGSAAEAVATVEGAMARMPRSSFPAKDDAPSDRLAGTGRRSPALTSLWARDAGAGPQAAEPGQAARPEDDADSAGQQARTGVRHLLAESAGPDVSAAAMAAGLSAQRTTPAPSDFAAGAASAQAGPPAGSTAAARVERIAERVEQAVRIEEGVASGRPVTIMVPLDVAGDGARSLTVTVTPAGVDVTLARVAGEASADLQTAAKTLVERLQRRFPKGVVRVFDDVGGAAEAHATPGRLASAAAPERDMP